MKRNTAKQFVFVIFAAAAVVANTFSQKVEIAPLPVRPSTLIEDLRALKAANPKPDAAKFVEDANRLLDKQGMNYSLFFDAATCTKIREAKAKQKDSNAPVKLGGVLNSVDGEKASLSLPEAQITSDDCGGCYLNIPLLQITATSFITVLLGRNIGFELPGNVAPGRVVLVDEKGSNPRKTWLIPRRMRPLGVTHDENVVYLAFPEPELQDISLAVFSEGTFQIATRAEAEEGGKGEAYLSTGTPKDMRITKFVRWGKTYYVGYWEPCS
jgi:hypothetical protein